MVEKISVLNSSALMFCERSKWSKENGESKIRPKKNNSCEDVRDGIAEESIMRVSFDLEYVVRWKRLSNIVSIDGGSDVVVDIAG
jgi:hypothetical protein